MITGRISFYCRALEVTRTAFYDYLDRKNKPWKYQPLADEMIKIHNGCTKGGFKCTKIQNGCTKDGLKCTKTQKGCTKGGFKCTKTQKGCTKELVFGAFLFDIREIVSQISLCWKCKSNN